MIAGKTAARPSQNASMISSIWRLVTEGDRKLPNSDLLRTKAER
jgi:hypothetical protein